MLALEAVAVGTAEAAVQAIRWDQATLCTLHRRYYGVV